MTFQYHHFYDDYKLPCMSDEQLKQLADDIQAHGQLEKVVTLGDGTIVGGRNRALACELNGREPDTRVYNEVVEGPVLAFMVSKNLHRMHMTDKERVRLFASMVTTSGPGGRPKPSQNDTVMTIQDAADAAGVIRMTMQRAVAATADTKRTQLFKKLPPEVQKEIEDHPDGGLLRTEELRTLGAYQEKTAWQEKQKRPGLLADQLAAIGPMIDEVKAKAARAEAEKRAKEAEKEAKGKSTKPSAPAPKPSTSASKRPTITSNKPEQPVPQPAAAETTHATDTSMIATVPNGTVGASVKTSEPKDTAATIINLAIVADRAELADLLEQVDPAAFVRALLALLRDTAGMTVTVTNEERAA